MILAQIVHKLHNYVKREFLGKTDQCNFVNLWRPIMQKKFQNKLHGRSRDIRSNNFGVN